MIYCRYLKKTFFCILRARLSQSHVVAIVVQRYSMPPIPAYKKLVGNSVNDFRVSLLYSLLAIPSSPSH